MEKTCKTPYHLQVDGQLERFNWTLSAMLPQWWSPPTKRTGIATYLFGWWRTRLQLIQPQGLVPNFMMFGREIILPVEVMSHQGRRKCPWSATLPRCWIGSAAASKRLIGASDEWRIDRSITKTGWSKHETMWRGTGFDCSLQLGWWVSALNCNVGGLTGLRVACLVGEGGGRWMMETILAGIPGSADGEEHSGMLDAWAWTTHQTWKTDVGNHQE